MEPGSQVKKPRKKVCPKCGRKLWLRDFYVTKATGQPHRYCKECSREMQRNSKSYISKRQPNGIRYNADTGRKILKQGYSRKIYWDGNMLSVLRRYFPNTRNEEVAEMLGVSPRTVVRKARELGIYKDADFVRKTWRENAMLANVKNRREGYKNLFQKGMIP